MASGVSYGSQAPAKVRPERTVAPGAALASAIGW